MELIAGRRRNIYRDAHGDAYRQGGEMLIGSKRGAYRDADGDAYKNGEGCLQGVGGMRIGTPMGMSLGRGDGDANRERRWGFPSARERDA